MQPHCGLIVKSLETEVKIRKRGEEANILCAGCGFQRDDRTIGPPSPELKRASTTLVHHNLPKVDFFRGATGHHDCQVEGDVNYLCPPQLTQSSCFQKGDRGCWPLNWRGLQLFLSSRNAQSWCLQKGDRISTPSLKRVSTTLVHHNLHKVDVFRGQPKYFSYW